MAQDVQGVSMSWMSIAATDSRTAGKRSALLLSRACVIAASMWLLAGAQAADAGTELNGAKYAATLTISQFTHTPHGGDRGYAAEQAFARIRGDRLVLYGIGPRSDEGRFFAMRLSLPLRDLATTLIHSDHLWISYSHGGEGGLKVMPATSWKGTVALEQKGTALRGQFDISLSGGAVQGYGFTEQRLQGTFEIENAAALMNAARNGVKLDVRPADFDELLLEQGLGLRAAVLSAKALDDGNWEITLADQHGSTAILDRYGNLVSKHLKR